MNVELLHLLYNTTPPLPRDNDFYLRCMDDLSGEYIWPQIYQLLKQSERLDEVPDFFRIYMQQKYEAILGQNLFIKHQSDRIFEVLENNHIPVIILKGTAFAERYFGHFAARATSDIDILVPSGDVPKAIQCLQEIGFNEPKLNNPLHFHYVLSKEVPSQGVALNVELHWALVQEHTANLNVEAMWNQGIPRESFHYIKELSVQHTFYSICLHGANHKMDSLRYYLDIIQMVHRFGDRIDYHALMDQAKDDKTVRRVSAALWAVYNRFPYLWDVKPLPLKGIWRRLPWKVFFLSPFLLVDGWSYRFLLMRQWVWPPLEVARWHTQAYDKSSPSNIYLRFYLFRIMKLLGKQ